MLEEEARARALGAPFKPSIEPPYRWRDWAALLDSPLPMFRQDGRQPGWKRHELTEAPLGMSLDFVNNQLFPYLRDLGHRPGTTYRQRVITMIFANKERTTLESETNLLDAIDRVDVLSHAEISDQHIRKLLEECDLWCVISLPPNVFVSAGAGAKTNLLFIHQRASHAPGLVLRSL